VKLWYNQCYPHSFPKFKDLLVPSDSFGRLK